MQRPTGHHEFDRRTLDAGSSSDRSFGLVFAAFFAIVTVYTWWHGGSWWPYYGGVALVFLTLALVWPASLALLNRLWMRFGLLLSKIVSPVILGLMFFVVVTPVGWLMRRSGKDPMRLRQQVRSGSYWIVRNPPGPSDDSMRDQF